MTTATVQLCGRWWRSLRGCRWTAGRRRVAHQCTDPADHPGPCRCRCGATTTRERTDR